MVQTIDVAGEQRKPSVNLKFKFQTFHSSKMNWLLSAVMHDKTITIRFLKRRGIIHQEQMIRNGHAMVLSFESTCGSAIYKRQNSSHCISSKNYMCEIS